MKEIKYVLTDPEGFHARPATVFVKKTAAYKTCEIKVLAKGKEVNGKSMMALMALGIKGGTEIVVQVSGDEEETAAAEIEATLKELL